MGYRHVCDTRVMINIEWLDNDGGWKDLHIDGKYVSCAYKISSQVDSRVLVYANSHARGYVDTIDQAKSMILALYALEGGL